MYEDDRRIKRFLDANEYEALYNYAHENEVSLVNAIRLLIENYLIENDDTEESQKVEESYEERLKRLEESDQDYEARVTGNFRAVEKLTEQVSELQEETERLQDIVNMSFSAVLSDEEVATIVDEPVFKVKQWRETRAIDINDRAFAALSKYEVFGNKWIER
ncbi:MAG: hypothetical protein AAFQ80_05530 [Cyanobacteria bacterium J06621_8]